MKCKSFYFFAIFVLVFHASTNPIPPQLALFIRQCIVNPSPALVAEFQLFSFVFQQHFVLINSFCVMSINLSKTKDIKRSKSSKNL
jgi:hypothetical protein